MRVQRPFCWATGKAEPHCLEVARSTVDLGRWAAKGRPIMAIFDKRRYDYRPTWSPAVRAMTIPLGIAMFALVAVVVPCAAADPASGQYVRTQSGRVRCLVMANDHGQGPAVACEASGPMSPPWNQRENKGFPQAPMSGTADLHWDLAVVNAAGTFRWDDGNIGGGGTPQNDTILNYGQSYHRGLDNPAATEPGSPMTGPATACSSVLRMSSRSERESAYWSPVRVSLLGRAYAKARTRKGKCNEDA